MRFNVGCSLIIRQTTDVLMALTNALNIITLIIIVKKEALTCKCETSKKPYKRKDNKWC